MKKQNNLAIPESTATFITIAVALFGILMGYLVCDFTRKEEANSREAWMEEQVYEYLEEEAR